MDLLKKEFNPSPSASNAFRNMFGPAEHIMPQAGQSHFSYVQPININTRDSAGGWHATTQVPKLGQGCSISIHDEIKLY